MSTSDQQEGRQASLEELEDMVASTDTGARNPTGPVKNVILGAAIAWSVFQVWIASPLPFLFSDFLPVLNDTHTRAIHLAFAMFLAYLAYPALKSSPRTFIPIQDYVLALAAAASAAYISVFYTELADRSGAPTTADLVIAGIGMVTLLEAARRSLGMPMVIVALVFLGYIFFGHLAPEVIAWKGASFAKAMSHQWLTTEGVFGIALGVSTSFVFLFVLFGAMLDKAGAGNYFIKVAFALMGALKGGPAKAAVLASGMTGLISGSSIANTVSTGVFTIPLMKRTGFTAEKAGAVEVASSVNGQIMPPVMGAAAFLMVEYVNIPYDQVVKHAFLPAIISYIALIYIVHLEAVKMGMEGLKRAGPARTLMMKLNSALLGFGGTAVIAAVIYFGFGWVKGVAGDATPIAATILLLIAYLALVWLAAKSPDLELDDPNSPVLTLPDLGTTARTGYYYLLPIIVLIWCLMIERLSPGLSAFWACVGMMFVMLTHKYLKAMFRGETDTSELMSGFADLVSSFIDGARNMIGIGIATAAAGIIVGTVTLTGIGQVMTEFVEILSAGSLILMLIFVAVISLILGMGLPTTANYIVVSSLMAGVIVELGQQNGLIVPLIAVHLFVFYFGIMADVTPPVGLASFAAAAVSGGDAIKTGVQAFAYSLRTATLPFIFIFNTKLLLIGISGPIDLLLTIFGALTAILVFSAAMQGFFITRSKIWESAILLLVAFSLFQPGFWLNQVSDPYQIRPAAEAMADSGKTTEIRLVMKGEDPKTFDVVQKEFVVEAEKPGTVAELIKDFGAVIVKDNDTHKVDETIFDSAAQKAGIDFTWELLQVKVPNDRMAAEIFYIPALLVLALIVLIQRRRRSAEMAMA